MTTRAADLFRRPAAAVFELFAAAVAYERLSTSRPGLKAAVRDFRGDDLFGAAAVGDRLVVVRYGDFEALGLGAPQRFDRVVMADGIFIVTDWRAAPPVGTPVFYRLAVRGGTK
jgi:hypothetical protein